MKKIVILLLLVVSVLNSWAQNTYPIHNATVFVKPDGEDTASGLGSFNNGISPDGLMTNLQNNMYSGNIKIYFAAGDYYTDFKFTDFSDSIQSISIYGGFKPSSRSYALNLRDFANYETRFHAGNQHMVWYETVGWSYPNGPGTNVIDGITFTSDSPVTFNALRLVGGDFIISQCKFLSFETSNVLLFFETAHHTVTMTNTLIAENTCSYLMGMATHLNLINETIADNIISNYMFKGYNVSTNTYDYVMQNSIVYGNTDMRMIDGSFDVYYSILEDQESWVNNIIHNTFNTDPVFTYDAVEPYSCDYYLSPAIANANPYYITLSPWYINAIMELDVVNNDRFWDYARTSLDAGAYQNGYDDGFYYYESNSTSPMTPKLKLSSRTENKQFSQSKNNDNIQVIITPESFITKNIPEQAKLQIYTITGLRIYEEDLHEGTNVTNITLSPNSYILKIQSSINEYLYTIII